MVAMGSKGEQGMVMGSRVQQVVVNRQVAVATAVADRVEVVVVDRVVVGKVLKVVENIVLLEEEEEVGFLGCKLLVEEKLLGVAVVVDSG